MISSKALIDQTGISRATLNNYIQLGILPKPMVQSLSADADEGGARVLGFFPDDALERVQAVQILKSQGMSMAEVSERLALTEAVLEMDELREFATQAEFSAASSSRKAKRVEASHIRKTALQDKAPLDKAPMNLNLSLDRLEHPAYMLNYNFELTWLNESARKAVFGFDAPPARSEQRNLLELISRPEARLSLNEQKSLARLHLQLASSRLSYETLEKIVIQADPLLLPILEDIQFQDQASEQMISEMEFLRQLPDGDSALYNVYAVYFREGMLVVHSPVSEQSDDLIHFLSRRDQVIQSLLSKRLPVMTPLAVLVADLQNSVRICSELPPDEYFSLINQIWSTMTPILRKYTGTHGKHAGDGVVYYFFPQPESNYLFNAVACAQELKEAMRKISADWQLKKNWYTELQLNIGLHEGQEWMGAFQSANHVEFAVLGNTINQASRLSDFARQGSIWATKDLISRLSTDERSRIDFGVLRKSQESGERFVPQTYAQIESLIDLQSDKYEKMRDIAQLAVAEIRRVTHTRIY